jgi:hypothetical protein
MKEPPKAVGSTRQRSWKVVDIQKSTKKSSQTNDDLVYVEANIIIRKSWIKYLEVGVGNMFKN